MTERKIIALNETDNTPERLLHRTLGKLADIESVMVVIKWTDDRGVALDWSRMKASANLALMSEALRYWNESWEPGPIEPHG